MQYLPEQCAEVQASLHLYVGEDLEPREIAEVGAHLEDCPPCSEFHERAVAARTALLRSARMTSEQSVPSLWEGVRAGLVAEGLIVAPEGLSVAPMDRSLALGSRARMWIAGAAAAAAAVLFSVSLQGPRGSNAGDAPDSGLGNLTQAAIDAGSGGAGIVPVHPAVRLETPKDRKDSKRENVSPQEIDTSGKLRRVGTKGVPLHHHAVEVLPEQGLYVLTPRGNSDLIGRSRQLRRVKRQ